jgi:hypothetical protein
MVMVMAIAPGTQDGPEHKGSDDDGDVCGGNTTVTPL